MIRIVPFLKKSLALVAFSLPWMANAEFAPKTVAFPLDGGVLQRIPERNKDLFKPSEVLAVTFQNRALYYVFHPEAARVIAKLKKEGVNIVVFTWETQPLAESLAKTALLTDLDGGKSIADIATVLGAEKQTPDRKFSETALGTPPTESLFISNKATALTPGMEQISYATGPIYYAFPSFAKANEARGSDRSESFPSSEEAWFAEWNKILIFYADWKIAAGRSNSRAEFDQNLKELQSLSARERAEAGLQLLESRTGSIEHGRDWKIEATASGTMVVQGCHAIERLPKKVIGDVDLSECERSLPMVFQITERNGQYACWSMTKSGAFVRQQSRIEPCLAEKTDQVQFYLTNPARPTCGAYSKTFAHLQDVDTKYCRNEFLVFDPSDRKAYTYDAFAGFESLTETQLLEKAKEFGSRPFVCLSVDQALDRVCARDAENDKSCAGGDRYAFITESCQIGAKNDLIPEIISLQNGELVPPSVYQAYEPERIARSLIYRYFQKNERPKMNNDDVARASYSFYKHQFPMMAFNLRSLPLIMKNGFLNLHQTGMGNGSNSPDARASAENMLMAVKFEATRSNARDAVVHRVRPKYSFAMFSKFENVNFPGVASQYGEYLVLFKSRIKRRMTITNGDSLGQRYRASTMYVSNQGKFNYRRDGSYYENQIWGDLTTGDVDGFLVGCPGYRASKEELTQALKAAHSSLPVYQCVDKSKDSFLLYEKGDLLYGEPTGP